MVMSKAKTVPAYLKSLPAERRKVISSVRDVIRRNLPKGYQERMNYGMISYEVPLERCPETYNGQPLSYIALAAQKNHFALYLICAYKKGNWLKEEFKKAGKKVDMGKSCVRFHKLDDLPLDVIAEAVALATPEQLIDLYQQSRKK